MLSYKKYVNSNEDIKNSLTDIKWTIEVFTLKSMGTAKRDNHTLFLRYSPSLYRTVYRARQGCSIIIQFNYVYPIFEWRALRWEATAHNSSLTIRYIYSGLLRVAASLSQITGVSYKWYASVAGLPNLYSVIDG